MKKRKKNQTNNCGTRTYDSGLLLDTGAKQNNILFLDMQSQKIMKQINFVFKCKISSY